MVGGIELPTSGSILRELGKKIGTWQIRTRNLQISLASCLVLLNSSLRGSESPGLEGSNFQPLDRSCENSPKKIGAWGIRIPNLRIYPASRLELAVTNTQNSAKKIGAWRAQTHNLRINPASRSKHLHEGVPPLRTACCQ